MSRDSAGQPAGRGRPWRPFGHPLHPATTHFPLALLLSTVVWDAIAGLTGDPFWDRMAFWILVSGLAASVVTLATGLVEYAALRADHPALSRANLHLILVLTGLTLFGASALFRGARVLGEAADPVAAVLTSGAGALVLAVGGWAGAELVYRHGVGVRKP